MLFRAIQLGFTLAAAMLAASPDTEYSARIWRSEDGLPQNKIQAISQTPDGYLWIGTSGGLVRFDGVRFVDFDRSNTPSFPDDSILVLCPIEDGSLWIGTEGGGLVHMRGSTFETFGAAEGLTNGFVRAILPEPGGVWVGTDRGFFRLEGRRFRRLDGRGEAPILATRAIFRDRKGGVWAATSRGLFTIRDGELRRPANAPYNDAIADLLEASNGELWLAADVGVHRLIGGRFVSPKGLRTARTRTIREDHEGNLWVGTIGEGLIRIGPRGVRVFRAADVLPDNTVWSIFEDREHNLWVGTQDGLLRLSASVVRTIASRNGLADDDVGSVYEDPGGRLWIGTIAGRLYRLENGRAVPVRLPAEAEDFRPRNIYVDREGVEWIGSAGQGLLRIEAGRRPRIFTMKDGLRSNGIRHVLEDRKGIIWIATGSGLSRWDGRKIRTYYLEDGLAYGGVRVLAQDANGDLLVGSDGGLNRVRDGRFVPDPVFARLGNERIWSILPANGTLWVGTRGNGLVRIRDGNITRYTTRDGLLSNSIYQILDDGGTGKEGGRFWMSSSAGIFSADRREMDAFAEGRAGPIAVMPYGTDDGMLSSQMSGGEQAAGCRTRTGEFWFPSVKGAVEIDPRQLRVPTTAPVTIESIVADDQPRPVIPGMMLPPGRGKLEVNFTSPNLLSPDRVTFRYRLEGFEEAWTSSGRRRVAYYTNLPPGKYRLHVVARDGAQPDRVSEVVLPFVWKAHFYETAWFYAALAGLAGICILAVFRFYARQTRARFALVLAERTRLAREMHDTVVQGCVAVSTLLEAAHSMPPSASGKVRELLDRAATQARLTVSEAREAVWDLRHSAMGQPGASGEGAPPEATTFAATLEDYARQVSAAEGIPVRAEVAGAPAPLEGTADRNLLLVAREAIRNAVTHAHPARIDVLLRFDPGEVRLEVRDDGHGFVAEMQHENGHYGIVGMRERVEQSGGTFQLRSAPGQGTLVVARLPLKRVLLKEAHAGIGADR